MVWTSGCTDANTDWIKHCTKLEVCGIRQRRTRWDDVTQDVSSSDECCDV